MASGIEVREPLLKDDPQQEQGRAVSAIANARWWSRLYFLWINPILELGSKRALTDSDMPKVAAEDCAREAFERFSAAFSSSTSLFSALFACYRRPLAINGVFALLKCVAVSGGPLVLKAFVTTAASTSADPSSRVWRGCSLVTALLTAKLVESASQRQWIFGSKRVGMQARSAIMAALYAKQLRRSMRTSSDIKGGGEVISYMAVDAYRIGELGYFVHLVWSIPLQIFFAAAILVHSVGLLPSVAGMSVIAASMLANRPLARMQRRFQDGVMRAQDDRLRATAAAVRNMKIIKLHAWEDHFGREIERLRGIEADWISKVQFRKTYNSFLFWLLPTLVSTSTFVTCWALGRPLDAGSAFTTLATFRIIQEPIRQVPEVISGYVQAKVAETRISTFLREQELDRDAVQRSRHGNAVVIDIQDASLAWELESGGISLRNINLRVLQGQKVAICGEVGSGKSTLLHSILGEVPKLCGMIATSGSFAFVPQTPWIQCGTIRDNILFGLDMVDERYSMALRVCALSKDLESLPYSDLTEIGERGVNLSGGQKQRIQLARAVYQDADVYLLDDPFSALDAETGSALFKTCILGALSAKTVVLVTHQVEFLPSFDNILIMQNGVICQSGRHSELLVEGSPFERLVTAHKDVMGGIDTPSSRNKAHGFGIVQKGTSDVLKPSQLTQQEERQVGDTGIQAYLDYMSQAHGFFYFGLSLLAYLVFLGGQMSANWWMASQVGNLETSTAKLIGVYSTIGLTTGCFLFFRSVMVVVMGLAASKSFFSEIMQSLFAAPISFFDSTPSGRILSRLSLDLSILDLDVAFSFAFSVSAFLNALTNLGMTTSVTWQILIVVLPLMYFNRVLQVYYLASARELMRINGTSKAPILNQFGEAISGATIIRAFGKQEQFMDKNLELIDLNSSPFFYNFAAREWLIQRLEALWSSVLCTSALIMVMLPPGKIAPGFVGMVLSYGLSLNISQVASVQNQCNLANMIISVERIKQYIGLPSEPQSKKRCLAPCWPSEGKIELQNLQIRYRPDAPLVLKGITCTFEPGRKVGIVGRTGSGKTTLISALFRLVDPVGGKIVIDGLDITAIGLRDLRSRLSIIPQEPTLFRGTIRFNLDPLSQFSDQEICEVLDKCQLWKSIKEKPLGLDSFVGDDGENWSIGERQLFCLGRVLLKNSQVLILDEATASIDNATDAIIQKLLRDEFRKCTTITVAHRIPTVINSDMVLTLQDGRMVEFDHPLNLLKETNTSLFARLVTEYWASLQTTK